MILHYFKIAWEGLFRKRLYTLICLFGISFTLTILFVGTSLYDYLLKPNYPEFKQDRILKAESIMAYKFSEGGTSKMSALMSYNFYSKCISNLKTPEKIGISKKLNEQVVYRNNKKMNLSITCTDARYWEIFDFECVRGKLFGDAEIEANTRVAIVTEGTAQKYFGSIDSALGQTIDIGNEQYRVTGIVKDVPANRNNTYSDIWLPLIISESDIQMTGFIGSYTAYLLAPRESDVKSIKAEIEKRLKNFQFPEDNKDWTGIQLFAHTHVESYFQKIFGVNQSLSKQGFSETLKFKESSFYLFLILSIILLMAFPAINLINIHISRIMERSSEIGIRRSYGARKQTLLYQLIVENLLLTSLGAMLALIFSLLILKLIEAGDYFPKAEFILNLRILGWGILFTLLFNLFSILIPAWKVSRIQIIQSLKGGEI